MPFEPKALWPEGQRVLIATPQSITHYDCKILGEIESIDTFDKWRQGRQNLSRESLRQGAINDARNQAGNFMKADQTHTLLLNITKEQATCGKFLDNISFDCTNGIPPIYKKGHESLFFYETYKINAQVLQCVTK